MDYEKFFDDVKKWIYECNSVAAKVGFLTDDFWIWAVKSLGDLTKKYNNEKLAMRQADMLLEWLEDTWKDMQNA